MPVVANPEAVDDVVMRVGTTAPDAMKYASTTSVFARGPVFFAVNVIIPALNCA